MTEEGVPPGFPARGPSGRRIGWYRDRQTGRRRFWNGSSWVDIAGVITPFAAGPEPIEAAPSARAGGPERGISDRTKRIALSVVVVVVVLAIAAGIDLSSSSTPTATNQTVPTTPSPSETTANTVATTSSTTSSVTSSTVASQPSASSGSRVVSPVFAGKAEPTVSVAVIGDSIIELASSALTHLMRHDTVYLDAVGGSRMAVHLPTIQQLSTDGTSWDWVIELGTNDALPPPDTNWSTDFDNEVAALQGQGCVVFVTVNPDLGSVATGIDDAITSAVAAHSNFHEVDWGTIELRRPAWLLSDQIHPSASGDVELAKLVYKAIRGCPS